MRYITIIIGIALLLSGCSKQPELQFEHKPFLGLKLEMTEEDVSTIFENCGLPYQIEKDTRKDILRKLSQERGYHFDESESTLEIRVKGNTRFKGQGFIMVFTKNGIVESISVSTTTREGIFPVDGEKEEADQIFKSLFNVLKQQYGKPKYEDVYEGNKTVFWSADNVNITLENRFDWDDNIHWIENRMEPAQAE